MSEGSRTKAEALKNYMFRLEAHGFVTWAYDCKTALRKPDEDDKAVRSNMHSKKYVVLLWTVSDPFDGTLNSFCREVVPPGVV